MPGGASAGGIASAPDGASAGRVTSVPAAASAGVVASGPLPRVLSFVRGDMGLLRRWGRCLLYTSP
ncbi:hypothetical protein, partial [Streptomyces sp. McG8]|uniref:hypothetical protein n=1 Tax=Streptomyces sp. McG8 TaxID=2725487 RepID=UPI003FD13121